MADPSNLRPLVVACLRHADQRPEVHPLTAAVTRNPRMATASAADWAALEHALRIGAAWDARVLAVTAGPSAADETLRQAVAAGADALRVDWPDTPAGYPGDVAGDERTLARAVAAGIRGVGAPALVVCGDRSGDRGTGALPAFLAHELGAAQALGLVALTVGDEALLGERRLDGGRRELVRIPRPAVCSVEGGVRLRRAPLSSALAAAAATVPVHREAVAKDERVRLGRPQSLRPRTQVAPPPAGAGPRDRVLQLTGALVTHEPPTVVGPTDAATAVDAFLDFLDRVGYPLVDLEE